jgi:hypothetical protein
MFCIQFFSYMKHKKPGISQVFVLGGFQNFSHILMKWNKKDAIFTKRQNFLLSGQIFRPFCILAGKFGNELATLKLANPSWVKSLTVLTGS